MANYKILLKYSDGTSEEDDYMFDSVEEANEYALYLVGCTSDRAEYLNSISFEDEAASDYEETKYEIIEISESEDW